MDPEDVENFKRVELEVQRLADIVERGDMRRGTVKFTVDMYTVVYSAATRCRIGDMDGQYAAAAALYARYEELLQDVVRRPLRLPSADPHACPGQWHVAPTSRR